jgi:signal transduction histidine kinase
VTQTLLRPATTTTHTEKPSAPVVHQGQRFVALAAHELRAPLGRLHGHIELLQTLRAEGVLSTELLDRSLGRMEASVTGLTTLLGDLMQLARLDSGQLQLRREPLDLARLVIDSVASFAERLPATRQFWLDLDSSIGNVSADRHALERVLENLLENAVKYSPSARDVHIHLQRHAGGMLLEVADEGIGLPYGTAERIFDAFTRADNARALGVPGAGLGLHVCYRMVKSHGGRMWAESPGEGRGTTILVWLPAAAA